MVQTRQGFLQAPRCIHSWMNCLLTDLIFFMQPSALLSCLRLEPTATESCIYPAWGLGLLFLPSSLFVSSLCHLFVSSGALRRHSSLSFFLLLVLKNIPGDRLSPCACLNLPLQLSRWVFFRHTNSKANFHLFWQNRPHDKASERHTGPQAHLREKLTNRNGDASSADDRKVKGPSKISFEVEAQSPDPYWGQWTPPCGVSKAPHISHSGTVWQLWYPLATWDSETFEM